ncbi:hypothetical protein [Rugosimonospora africana]|uniref:hypothetical protein n=1 Tax=Rugosimonospora africana TaxID=556532 RepID=UPI00194200B7|nr:hypothetical protein [Rugosimonospora africana]
MTGNSVAEKLGIKQAQSVLVINPPGDYGALVGGLPPGAVVVRHRPADVVHAFATTPGELAEHGPVAAASVLEDGLVWISYPTDGRSDINQDLLRTAIDGWRPVNEQISIDGDWSAMQFRRESEVGSA